MLKCGLLGEKLGHSYSPQIHSMLADYEYKLFEKSPEELESFLKSGDFDGINVTIPYKKAVMPYCAELSDTAKQIGSVNTIVRRSDGSLFGDNTDAFGFENLILHKGIEVKGKKALVLGTGGASVTAQAVLRKLGASVVVISRKGENNYDNIAKHSDAQIIANTTPVGMYPNNGKAAVDLSLFHGLCGVLDVVYNPARTALLMQAERLGIPCAGGLYMLVSQAKRSSELFMGKTIADSEIDRIEKVLKAQMQNIVIIGMPGSGKSTVSAMLAEKLGRQVEDADVLIAQKAGMSITEIFATQGESGFRKLETEVLAEVGKKSGLVISTGGGCVTVPDNYRLLHQNGIIVWIKRDTKKLARDGRPISLSSDMDRLYSSRRSFYECFADLTVDNNGDIKDTVNAITEMIK